jgi:regulator of replication initiation timing
MRVAKIKRALAMLEQLGIGHGVPENPAEEFFVAIEAMNELMSLVACAEDLQKENRTLREVQTETQKWRMEKWQKNTARVKDVIQYIYDNGHHKDCPKTQDIDDNNDCDCGYDEAMGNLKELL